MPAPATAETGAPTEAVRPTATPAGVGAAPEAAPAENGDGPAALPGYPDLTIPQLRGRLRFLSAADLTALLEWETAHADRAPYRTMLSNRIATVTES
jgi:hypothetical protein